VKVEQISPGEGTPEVEDLIPEVREIQRRRRSRLLDRVALLVVGAVVVLAAIFGAGAAGIGPVRGLLGGGTSAEALGSSIQGIATWPSFSPFDISCPQAGACVVVGIGDVKHRNQLVFADQRGVAWGAPVNVPTPNNTWWNHQGIACSNVDLCVTGDGIANLALIAPQQGKWLGFHLLPFPHPYGHSLLQASYACSPGGSCWAIVQHWAPIHGIPGASADYAVGETGGRWLRPYRLASSVHVRGQALVTVQAQIVCPSTNSCTVGGIAYFSKGAWRDFVQAELNGTWSAASVAPSAKTDPFRLSFPPAFSCTATSCLLGGSVDNVGAVEQEANGRWLPPVVGLGASKRFVQSEVLAVACHGANLCVATGEATRPNVVNVPFVQTEVNGRWFAPVQMPGLAGQAYPWSTQAACTGSETCEVVGQENLTPTPQCTQHTSGGVACFPTLVARYSGSRWRYLLITFNGALSNVGIMNMSCAETSCWLVGNVSGKAYSPGEGVVIPFPSGTG
jgi:hypothetical protein